MSFEGPTTTENEVTPLPNQEEMMKGITEQEEKDFIDSFNLPPEQKKYLKEYIKTLNDPDTVPIRIERFEDKLPLEILKTDLIRKLAKKVFYTSIALKDGLGSGGDWSEYMERFGIEEEFFKQKDFFEYKKKKWLHALSYGYEFYNPNRFKKNRWGYIDDTEVEKRKREEDLQLGTLESVGLSPEMPEVKNAAAEGIINEIFSTVSLTHRKENSAEIIFKKYTEFFKVSSKDLQKVLKSNFQGGGNMSVEKNNTLRKKYPFIEDFFNLPETREMAKQMAADSFIATNEDSADSLASYFSLSESEFNKKDLLEKQQTYALNNLKSKLQRNESGYHFYYIEDASRYLSKENWQSIFGDKKLSSVLTNALAKGIDRDWLFEKNIEVIKKIGVPEEMLRKASVAAIGYRLSEESYVKPETIESLAQKMEIPDSGFKEGITLGMLDLIKKYNSKYDIERIKETFKLSGKIDSPEIQNKAKKMFLEKLESAYEDQLELIDSIVDIQWSKMDKVSRKEAVKKSLVEGQLLKNNKSVEAIDDFISKYYPETHKLFLIVDPEVKEAVKKILLEKIFYDFDQRGAPRVKESAVYFNIPIDDLAKITKERISGGSFIEGVNQGIEQRYKDNLNIDIRKENEICLKNHVEDLVEKYLENKNWRRLLDIKDYENGNSAMEKVVKSEINNIGDMEKSFDQRRYATEVFLKLNPMLSYNSQAISGLFYDDHSLKKEFNGIVDYKINDLEEFVYIRGAKYSEISNFSETDYARAISAYIDVAEEKNSLGLADEQKESIKKIFQGPYKDTCLSEIQEDWVLYLSSKEMHSIPPKLFLISEAVNMAGGAGNLKYVESLGNFMFKVNETNINSHTVQRTKEEIRKALILQEKRIEKEKWSQDDRAEFYNLSTDILEAAPSLYSEFSPIFEKLSPKDMKTFMKELFPLYQAQLVITQQLKGEDFVYRPKDLVVVRQALQNFTEKIEQSNGDNKNIFFEEKTRLVDILKDSFKNRFGLLKVPEQFTKENIRSIQNNIRYIGNISERNEEREVIIAFYLGLELNDEWSAFREGKEVKVEEYFSDRQLEVLRPLLEEKMNGYDTLARVAGISKEQMPRFQEILQEDTISNLVGSIQTVDVKLGDIKRNVEELTDPDIYENPKDKEMVILLDNEGELVWKVLAKTYSELLGKGEPLSESEKMLQSKIATIFEVVSWNTDEVKKIQNLMQPLKLVSNMINKMEEERVDDNITELKKRLVPTKNIIDIFNRLGEDFKQESGAMALSKDITYLESLVVKDDKKLTVEEKEEIKKYLDLIKEKMKDLEGTLDKVREYFDKIKNSSHLENHALLKNRLADIEKIIRSKDSDAVIISHMTKDLNLIIENMRQCLGCMHKEHNNDTNLAFGDYNKFFMMNQSEKEKGSISDEIVFFVPVTMPDGKKEMSFILDQVYGSKSSDVLMGNILSVYKKYQALKKEFPEVGLSICISSEAISSAGIDIEILKNRLEKTIETPRFGESSEGLSANIPKSAFSDNYIEFGSGDVRTSGERQFSGLVLR